MTNQMVKKLTAGILFAVLMLALAMTAVLSVTSESTAYADGHTHDGVNFNPWNSSYDLPTSSGNYYLTADVTIGDRWEIEYSKTIRLCLNGHTVTCNGSSGIAVYEGCTLAIYDDTGEGKIINGGNASTGLNVDDNSTFYLYGGEISGFKGNGIYSRNSSVYLYGGKIADNGQSSYAQGAYIWNSELHLSGTVFSGNTSGDIYVGDNNYEDSQAVVYIEGALSGKIVIAIDSLRTFTSGWSTYMDGEDPADYFTPTNGVAVLNGAGEVMAAHVHDNVVFTTEWSSYNSLPTSAGNYYLTDDVTLGDNESWIVPTGVTNLCLNGHNITTPDSGYFIIIYSGCTLKVYDATANPGAITTTYDGDDCQNGVWIEGGSFYLYGGKITGFSGNGVAENDDTGNTNLYGGEISGNCVGVEAWNDIHLSGTVFTDNVYRDIDVFETNFIIIDGALNGRIVVCDQWEPYRTFTSGWSTHMSGEDPADYFTFTVGVPALDEDGEVEAIVPPHIHNGITFERWDNPYDLPSSGSYYLATDVSTDYYWSINDYAELNLCLNGHTITFTGEDSEYVGVSNWDDHKAATLKIYDDTGNGVITTTYTGESRFINIGSTYNEEGQHFYLYGGKITGFKKGVITNRGYDYLTACSVHLCGGEICDNDSYDIELLNGSIINVDGTLTEGSPIVVSTVDYAFTSGWDDKMSGEDPADYFTFTDNNYFAVLNSNGEVQAHAHNWTYSANGNVITEHCSAANCPLSDRTLTLSASGKDYDGTAVVASYEVSADWSGGSPEISYTGNTNAGTYTASVTVEGATATADFTIAPLAAVNYKTAAWTNNAVVLSDASTTQYLSVTDAATAWTNNTYVVGSDVTISDRIEVSGTVYLILCDGFTLTASKGIRVSDGNTLYVYGQTNQTGALIATVDAATGNAVIGGNGSYVNNGTAESCGTVIIHGGVITAQGGTHR